MTTIYSHMVKELINSEYFKEPDCFHLKVAIEVELIYSTKLIDEVRCNNEFHIYKCERKKIFQWKKNRRCLFNCPEIVAYNLPVWFKTCVTVESVFFVDLSATAAGTICKSGNCQFIVNIVFFSGSEKANQWYFQSLKLERNEKSFLTDLCKTSKISEIKWKKINIVSLTNWYAYA